MNPVEVMLRYENASRMVSCVQKRANRIFPLSGQPVQIHHRQTCRKSGTQSHGPTELSCSRVAGLLDLCNFEHSALLSVFDVIEVMSQVESQRCDVRWR